MNSVKYSIIVPVFKSVITLEKIYFEVEKLMAELQETFELIFIEDSGSDETWCELLKIKKEAKDKVKIIKLAKNFGQNSATMCGIDESIGEKIITIDDDLQHAPSEIKKLIQFQEEHDLDVVYGVNKEINPSVLQRIGSRLIKKIFNLSQGGESVGSSFRLIDSHIVKQLKQHTQDHLFINQVIPWYTTSIDSVEVNKVNREEGKSGYSLIKLMKLSFRLIFYYTSIPIKIVIAMGILAGIGLIAMIIYYIFFQLRNEESIDLFLVTVLISMSCISMSIAIFGIYINRLYNARVNKASYAIKAKL